MQALPIFGGVVLSLYDRIMKECIVYKAEKNNSVRCCACSHFCLIKEGNVGLCGVRLARGKKLYLLTYGKAVAAHIDPIEKKPLYHFLPGSRAYSLGTLGCNLRCSNCQNFDISQMFGMKGIVSSYGKFNWGLKMNPRTIVEKARESGCDSIAYTYNEPTIFLEYALDIMKYAHEKGLKNVWVTNGYMSSDTLELILPLLDAANVDIKSFDPKFYRNHCGAKLQPILENCEKIVQGGIWLEVTTLVIPGLSDDSAMLNGLARYIAEKLGLAVPWHISAFSGSISWKMQEVQDTPFEKMKEVRKIGKKAGLKFVYLGNILDMIGSDTECPRCGERVVERVFYKVARSDERGACRSCGFQLPGVWN